MASTLQLGDRMELNKPKSDFIISFRHNLRRFVCFLVMGICFSSVSEGKVLVISDIDDTIKVSHVLSKIGAATSALDDNSHFVGMAEVYQALKKQHQDIEFHYVSLAPKILMKGRHLEFLKDNGFPVTQLHMNPSFTQDPQLKQKIIRKILKAKQPDLVINFGDNGQFDVVVYDDMKKEFPKIRMHTYIREAYSSLADSVHPTLPDQVGFVTSMEVALDLKSHDLLSAGSYSAIETLVYGGLLEDDGDETFGKMVFPWWQDCRDFKWQWSEAQPSNQFEFIRNAIQERCQ